MILSQILYQKKLERKSVVVLILGKKGDKIAAILDEAIDRKEAEIIMKNNKKLDNYPLHNKIQWIKEHTPMAYRNGYREFFMNKVTVQRSYSLTNKQYIKQIT